MCIRLTAWVAVACGA